MTRLIDAEALLQALEIEIHKKYPFSLKDLITNAPTVEQGEPFGYFKAEPFGWTDCSETDEGAIALYENPPASTVETQRQWVSLSNDDFKDTSWFTDKFIEGANWAQNKLKELNHD